MQEVGATQSVRTELTSKWWRGDLGARPGHGTIHLPVGAGRRRLLLEVLEIVRSHVPDTRLVLVTTATLAEVWLRDLNALVEEERFGVTIGAGNPTTTDPVDIVITTPDQAQSGIRSGRPVLLVVDEPGVIDAPALASVEQHEVEFRLDLHAAPPPSASAPLSRLTSFEAEVGHIVAGLIDGQLEQRAPWSFDRWATSELGSPITTQSMWPLMGFLHDTLAHALATLVESGEASTVGSVTGGQPIWTSLVGVAGRRTALVDACLVVRAGVLAPERVAIQIKDGHGRVTPRLVIAVASNRPADIDSAYHRLRARALRAENLYRGGVLHARSDEGRVKVEAAPAPTVTRADLILPDELWVEVDRNIHGLFEAAPLLQRLGLGLNRGLLLYGPPGTGKTQLTCVVARELLGTATSLFVATDVMRNSLSEVYELAAGLAPALVVLEDVDLVVGQRGSTSHEALVSFLTTIDGAMTSHDGVVTLATTNVVEAIDVAARRAARFDRVLEVPLPPAEGRRRIWDRYVRELNAPVEVEPLVRQSAGASGADIREVVRHAVLDAGEDVTTVDLLRLTRERGFPAHTATGQYL